MSTIYKLRIILDSKEDVFRDIDITSEDNLMHLHESILEAFEIAPGEMASFYVTNENWEQEAEIPMFDMGVSNEVLASMDQQAIGTFFSKRGNRLLYIYDHFHMWTFFVEQIGEYESNDLSKFPLLSYEYGTTPKEAPEKDFGGDEKSKAGLFGDAFEEDENEEDDEFGDFDESGFNTDEW